MFGFIAPGLKLPIKFALTLSALNVEDPIPPGVNNCLFRFAPELHSNIDINKYNSLTHACTHRENNVNQQTKCI
jgi:hypothetical protein